MLLTGQVRSKHRTDQWVYNHNFDRNNLSEVIGVKKPDQNNLKSMGREKRVIGGVDTYQMLAEK